MSGPVTTVVAPAAPLAGPAFLATVTHEVRTPLNAVIGMTELLRQMTLPPEAARLIETIHMSGECLLALVDDLLDTSRLDAGRLQLEDVEFVLRDVVEEAIAIATATSGVKRLSVAAVIDPALPDEVRGDPRRFGQVLANLLANAVKFTLSGYVRLRLTCVQTDGTGLTLRVEVEDSGIGIASDALPRLFIPFSQADDDTSRRFGGTGLGLAIANGIVAAMGARIEVDSTPGRGSRFHFEVRLPAGRRSDALALPNCEGLRVVVASRDDILVEALLSQMARIRVQAVVTRDVESVPPLARTGPAAVLIDPRLPDASACVAASRVADVPVVELVPPRSSVTVRDALPLRTPVRLSELTHVLTTLRPEDAASRSASLASPRAGTPPSVPFPRGIWRVLAVEDHEPNQQLLQHVLDSVGVEVDVVVSGEAACEAVRHERYDLILMDCRLPGMDGLATTRALRARPALAHVPVIGLTASTQPGTRQACLEAGMDDFLPKPTRPSILIDALRRWLPPSGADEDAARDLESSRAPAAPETLLDHDVVDELLRLGVFVDMARVVLRHMPAILGELDAAVVADDRARLGLLAHRLVTLLGNIGWHEPADLAGQLESACADDGTIQHRVLATSLVRVVLDGLPRLERLTGRAAGEASTCAR